MSNPQGPDRQRADDVADAEQTGELPAWGHEPPPGGWGSGDAGATGAWDPDRDPRDGLAGQGPADAGWDPRTAAADARRDAGRGAEPASTGGWAPQHPGAGDPQSTGGWDPQSTGGWDPRVDGGPGGWDAPGGPQTADGGATQAAPLWGDDAAGTDDGWAVPTGRRGRRRGPEQDPGTTDAVPAGSPGSSWAPTEQTPQHGYPDEVGAGAAGGWESGDEPWAPRENVTPPRTGPLGLGPKGWGLVAAGVVVVAVLAVTALLVPGWAVTRSMDQTALQNGVTQVLTQDYGLDVGAVQCPDDVRATAGTQFRCQAVVDGEQVEVPGVVTSDEGDYQVNRV